MQKCCASVLTIFSPDGCSCYLQRRQALRTLQSTERQLIVGTLLNMLSLNEPTLIAARWTVRLGNTYHKRRGFTSVHYFKDRCHRTFSALLNFYRPIELSSAPAAHEMLLFISRHQSCSAAKIVECNHHIHRASLSP